MKDNNKYDEDNIQYGGAGGIIDNDDGDDVEENFDKTILKSGLINYFSFGNYDNCKLCN